MKNIDMKLWNLSSVYTGIRLEACSMGVFSMETWSVIPQTAHSNVDGFDV